MILLKQLISQSATVVITEFGNKTARRKANITITATKLLSACEDFN
jgi:hypothetical protein